MKITSGLVLRCGMAMLAAALLGGCSVSRALDGSKEKNYGVLEVGTHRDLVRAELGEPRRSADGPNCDLYSVAEGTSAWRYLRAFGYSVVDIGTLGVGEAVTEPLETSLNKGSVQIRVCFDGDQRLTYSERLQPGEDAVIVTGTTPKAK